MQSSALLFAFVVAANPAFELDGSTLKVPSAIAFETGSAKLTPESAAALEHVKRYLTEKTYVSTLRIEVHSDSGGDEAKTQALTESRALAVAKALVNAGVDCQRLMPVGFGSTKPIAANDTPEGRAANRRTTFVNAALRGRAIGGMPLDGGGKVAGDACTK